MNDCERVVYRDRFRPNPLATLGAPENLPEGWAERIKRKGTSLRRLP